MWNKISLCKVRLHFGFEENFLNGFRCCPRIIKANKAIIGVEGYSAKTLVLGKGADEIGFVFVDVCDMDGALGLSGAGC